MRRRFRSGTSPWEHLRVGIGDTGVVGGNCTQPVPYILPSAPEPYPEDRTDRCRRLPGRGITNPDDPSRLNALDAAVCLRPPQQAQEGLGPRPWRAITSPPWYAVPVSQSLTTRRTRYRGFLPHRHELRHLRRGPRIPEGPLEHGEAPVRDHLRRSSQAQILADGLTIPGCLLTHYGMCHQTSARRS